MALSTISAPFMEDITQLTAGISYPMNGISLTIAESPKSKTEIRQRKVRMCCSTEEENDNQLNS
jgi:hypothetical protein